MVPAPGCGWPERISLALVCVSLSLSGCRSCDPGASETAFVDAGAAPDEDLTIPLTAGAESDPVAAVMVRLPRRTGACAQVRSLARLEEATATARAVAAATSFPVEVITRDLGAKGIWHRVCVGDEDNAARLTASATRWTAPDGVLAPFLDPPRSSDEPRFHVLARATVEGPRPTVAQARAFLARSPEGPAYLFGPAEHLLLVGTGPTAARGIRLVAVSPLGAIVSLDPSPPPGCASCAVAEQQSPIVGRRPLAAGDVLPLPGIELLVEEETASGSRFLAMVTVGDEAAGGRMRRSGAVLLAMASNDVVLRGEAQVVEGDGDDSREIAVTRLELRTRGAQLCSLSTKAEVWGAGVDVARGLSRIDVQTLIDRGTDAAGTDIALVDHVTALDGAGDPAAASRACAEALAQRPGSLITQLCLQRVRGLVADGRAIDAVNAAGALAERAPILRAAVAGPLYSAMSALDADPRLSAAPYDCEAAPLLVGIDQMEVDAVVTLARARLQERLSLSDVGDAVFVTASRDFGTDTPVLAIASRWMQRLRATQPARHAAIEAALLPPSSDPDPSTARPDVDVPVDDAGPGFGGAP
jgi:hypothetical protein